MRHILTSFILVAAIATAADVPSDFAYLHGSVEGIPENALGTLDLVSAQVLVLHTPTVTLELPYAAITKSEHKPAAGPNDKEPAYMLWTLGKKFMSNVPTEEVRLEFKDKTGKPANMTLELYRPQVEKIMPRIERAAARTAAARGDFWGDRVWKTKRNQERWTASEVATRE